jgi:hypothetical protein
MFCTSPKGAPRRCQVKSPETKHPGGYAPRRSWDFALSLALSNQDRDCEKDTIRIVDLRSSFPSKGTPPLPSDKHTPVETSLKRIVLNKEPPPRNQATGLRVFKVGASLSLRRRATRHWYCVGVRKPGPAPPSRASSPDSIIFQTNSYGGPMAACWRHKKGPKSGLPQAVSLFSHLTIFSENPSVRISDEAWPQLNSRRRGWCSEKYK